MQKKEAKDIIIEVFNNCKVYLQYKCIHQMFHV